MTDNNNLEKAYPTKPDYDRLVFGPAVPASKYSGDAPEKRRQSEPNDIKLLAIVAAVLLALISGSFIIITNGILIRHNGKFSFLLRQKDESDYFKPSVTASPVVTDNGIDIDLSDPPGLGTAEVENPGVLSTAEIAEKVAPSVVAILSSGVDGQSIVSGVILTENGFIVTSASAVKWASGLTVVVDSGERFEAELVGMNLGADLAVIKISAAGLDSAVFGNSDAVMVGDKLVAIGTPYNLTLMGTTTSGIVSALNRNIIHGGSSMSLIQSDITVSSGFSGGPIINVYGQVVGIITCAVGGDYDGFSFAIPMNSAKTIIESIVNSASESATYSSGACLGIDAFFMSKKLAAASNLPVGLCVTGVYEGSSAYDEGLRAGDVITEIDGVRLTDLLAYNTIKESHSEGDIVELTVYRDEDRFDDEEGEYLEIAVYFIDSSQMTEKKQVN